MQQTHCCRKEGSETMRAFSFISFHPYFLITSRRKPNSNPFWTPILTSTFHMISVISIFSAYTWWNFTPYVSLSTYGKILEEKFQFECLISPFKFHTYSLHIFFFCTLIFIPVQENLKVHWKPMEITIRILSASITNVKYLRVFFFFISLPHSLFSYFFFFAPSHHEWLHQT